MRNLHKVLISLVLMALSVPVWGQANLEKWVAKCEKIESVDITVIKRKDPKTGKLEKDMTTISFQKNDALYKELAAACAKDEEKAYEVINRRKDGKEIPQIYRFRNGDVDIQYLFSISKGNSVSVTIIKRQANDSQNKQPMVFSFSSSD